MELIGGVLEGVPGVPLTELPLNPTVQGGGL